MIAQLVPAFSTRGLRCWDGTTDNRWEAISAEGTTRRSGLGTAQALRCKLRAGIGSYDRATMDRTRRPRARAEALCAADAIEQCQLPKHQLGLRARKETSTSAPSYFAIAVPNLTLSFQPAARAR